MDFIIYIVIAFFIGYTVKTFIGSDCAYCEALDGNDTLTDEERADLRDCLVRVINGSDTQAELEVQPERDSSKTDY